MGGATMSLDLYTRNIPLTQKAKFWGNYVGALKGNADLCAAPEARVLNFYPSITQTIPPTFPDLRNEFGKLENLMWKQVKNKSAPTPVLPAANDRIHTLGYNYCPVHTEIYGSYRCAGGTMQCAHTFFRWIFLHEKRSLENFKPHTQTLLTNENTRILNQAVRGCQ